MIESRSGAMSRPGVWGSVVVGYKQSIRVDHNLSAGTSTARIESKRKKRA